MIELFAFTCVVLPTIVVTMYYAAMVLGVVFGNVTIEEYDKGFDFLNCPKTIAKSIKEDNDRMNEELKDRDKKLKNRH